VESYPFVKGTNDGVCSQLLHHSKSHPRIDLALANKHRYLTRESTVVNVGLLAEPKYSYNSKKSFLVLHPVHLRMGNDPSATVRSVIGSYPEPPAQAGLVEQSGGAKLKRSAKKERVETKPTLSAPTLAASERPKPQRRTSRFIPKAIGDLADPPPAPLLLVPDKWTLYGDTDHSCCEMSVLGDLLTEREKMVC
jgi:hypothetical protein